MPKTTDAQMMTATCCVRESLMRGTLRARLMAAKASSASRLRKRGGVSTAPRKGKILGILRDSMVLTHCSDDLSLHAELVRESAREIVDSTAPVPGDVRHSPDVIEHMAAGEQEDQDQADSSPQVPVLDDGQDVGVCDGDEGEEAEEDRDGRANPAVVDGPADAWIVAGGELACDPAVHALCGLWS